MLPKYKYFRANKTFRTLGVMHIFEAGALARQQRRYDHENNFFLRLVSLYLSMLWRLLVDTKDLRMFSFFGVCHTVEALTRCRVAILSRAQFSLFIYIYHFGARLSYVP